MALQYPGSLHDHTDYSNLRLRDATTTVESLMDRAIELGQTVLAYTEHETVANAIRIEKYYNKVKKDHPDFKVIRGNEIYLCRDGLNGQNFIRGQDKYYHFILLAKDTEGHEQIRELSTRAWMRSYSAQGLTRVPTYYSDLIEVIGNNRGHVIGSTACVGGWLGQTLYQYEKDGHDPQVWQHINDWLNSMIKLFGEGNFFLEMQPGTSEIQKITNKYILQLSAQLNIPYIITCDTHYLRAEDRPIHEAFLKSQSGDRETFDFYESTYLMETNEIEQRMSDYMTADDFQYAYQNIIDIANMCEDYSLLKPLHIPSMPWKKPKGLNIDWNFYEAKIPYMKTFHESAFDGDRLLAQIVCEKIESDSRLQTDEIYNEVNENLESTWISSEVNKTHWSAYFLNLQGYIDVCWDAGSLVGPGRGSGVGFILLYLLDIIQINPKWETTPTYSWRFLNPNRVSVLDIDTDIEGGRRPQVLQALRDTYGQDRVANVVTFGTEKSKSAIQTACFKKGTLIDTINGEKPIEEIQSGDIIKTADGYEPVIAPTYYKGIPNYRIKTKNFVNEDFYCTEDHEILTVEGYRRVSGQTNSNKVKELFPELRNLSSLNPIYDKYVRNICEVIPIWKPAKKIINKHDYGLTLIDTKIDSIKNIHWINDFRQRYGIGISENIPINEDFCELIGIWIAEGSINRASNAVSFTINKKEDFLKRRIIELMWNIFQVDNVCITTRKDSEALTIIYSSSQLAQFFFELFENQGIWREKRADNVHHYLTQWDKRIPPILMKIDPYLQLQIIKGWFLGDGYARGRDSEAKGSRCMKCTTVSKNLAKDMIELFHRNFINPSVDIEKRSLTRQILCDCYNLSLYGDYGDLFYNVKYTSEENYKKRLEIPLEVRRKDDLPVFYNNHLYMKMKLEVSTLQENSLEQTVYCLKMPHSNFCVNNVIVHNCRGLGIDVDEALYIASLIPSDRGITRTLKQCYYGDAENGFEPIPAFVTEMDENPDLWKVAQNIEGLISRVGEHAGGVIFVDEPFTKSTALMKVPNGDVVTQFDLHDCEDASQLRLVNA